MIKDNGSEVTLDLHGRTVEEAERLFKRVLAISVSRGRYTVRVIHGSSTSDVRFRNRTIKHALYDLLESGALEAYVTEALRGEDYLLLKLPFSGPVDRSAIRMTDLAM